MAKQPDEYNKVRRRAKSPNGGANLYINADVLCMALANAGMKCTESNLQFKATACKDGKRAKIIIRITKAK